MLARTTKITIEIFLLLLQIILVASGLRKRLFRELALTIQTPNIKYGLAIVRPINRYLVIIFF
jgi:hypothetical protein